MIKIVATKDGEQIKGELQDLGICLEFSEGANTYEVYASYFAFGPGQSFISRVDVLLAEASGNECAYRMECDKDLLEAHGYTEVEIDL